ncbi:MAG: alpha/beta hydrolase, partial [Aquabacterium sp.]|nr:alpha/beta hydrolase [Aquabacterium sp.]
MRAGKIAAGVLLALVAVTGVGVALSWAPDRPVETLTARWAP